MNASTEFSIISDKTAKIGESPIWSQADGVLYWIDCNAPALFRLDLESGEEHNWSMPYRIGGVVPARSGVMVALKGGVFSFDPETEKLEEVARSPLVTGNMALHEPRCDPAGQLWVGAINLDYIHNPLRRGGAALFKLVNGQLERSAPASGGTVSNGLAWSPDGSVMYYADTAEKTIFAFDYDVQSGEASNKRIFHQLWSGEGVPDGAAVDIEGGYWFACPGAGRIRRLNPDGTVDREWETPCDYPTKVGFAGPNMEKIIVSSLSMRGAKPGKEDLEGRLYAAPAPIPGMPEPLYDPTR